MITWDHPDKMRKDPEDILNPNQITTFKMLIKCSGMFKLKKISHFKK
jgi:hypothetical protein